MLRSKVILLRLYFELKLGKMAVSENIAVQ